MKPSALLLAALPVLALSPDSRAMDFAERRGDFWYDSEGTLVAARHAEWPEGVERRPMSHREKMQMLGLQLPAPGLRALKPRAVPMKHERVHLYPELQEHVVIVKFRDDTPVRLRGGALTSFGRAAGAAQTVLAAYPDGRLERGFSVEERILDENRETGQLLSGKELADLNNYYVVRFPEGSRRGIDVANELLALDEVETAYLEAPQSDPSCADILPVTGTWETFQNYLDPAPAGLDSEFAWAYHAGGDGFGSGYWVMDCERTWTFDHEDLNFSASDVVNGVTGAWYSDHGTAVVGEYGACDNGYGMTGMTPDVALKAMDHNTEPTFAAGVAVADAWLVAGEIMLLESQLAGPPSGGICPCNCPDFDSVPVEYDAMTFAAIQTATANGIIVVEAGANGSANLDNIGLYGNLFQLWFRDSGAILVGASDLTHAPMCFTSTGSRIDVHAYGTSVYSTGYGDQWSGSFLDKKQDYTASFNGTSSASPMIVGACASLQGIAKAKYGVTLTPAQMRSVIKLGGTPQLPGGNIGPMPNLAAAINVLEPDLREYQPVGWSYPIVPRSTADATSVSAVLPTGALPGNGASTYYNFALQNSAGSYTPAVNSPDSRLHLEDTPIWEVVDTNLAPGAWGWAVNLPTVTKGGRHSLTLIVDYAGVESESNEGNNAWRRQFIWSGLGLIEDVPLTRTADPIALGANYAGPWYNAEGVHGSTGTTYWHAFAVAPTLASDDFDVRLNTEVPANVPQAGFGAHVAWSSEPAGMVDFVVLDRNQVGAGTFYASLVNFSGSGSKIVEFESDDGALAPGVHGPYTIQAGDLVDVHEVFLNTGQEYRVHVEVLSGLADIGISVFDGTGGFFDKTATMPGGFGDAAGPGQDEYAVVAPAANDFYGAVVWKRGSADVSQSLTYNLHVSVLPNLVGSRAPSGWDRPIVPRNTRDAVFLVDLPAMLNGNAATTSFNWATYNEGANQAPGPWRTDLFVDDVLRLTSTAAGSLNSGAYYAVMNSVQSTVTGGRHHLRSSADVLAQLTEFDEADNARTEAFVWSPLSLTDGVPVTRAAPPRKDPLGYGPWWSVDGLRAAPTTYWTAVGIVPVNAADTYDLRMHDASTGSEDGFAAPRIWSYDGSGDCVFALTNYNLEPLGAKDYGILNWSGTGNVAAQRSDAPILAGYSGGVVRYGPYSLGAGTILAAYEFYLDPLAAGTPLHVSVNATAGTANLVVAIFDGQGAPAYGKYDALALVDAAGGGADEHLPPLTLSPGFYAVVVHKRGSADLPLTANFDLVLSGANVVGVEEAQFVPSTFALAAPRPNPVRDAVTLEFDVPAGGEPVRLGVFDLMGRQVATLADGSVAAGRHAISWNGRSSTGERTAAGVYFVRLDAPSGSWTRKVTLLR
ncbi:MAG: S8 family serine peptidase [Candidatus Eiseniibacteriota bacterium]